MCGLFGARDLFRSRTARDAGWSFLIKLLTTLLGFGSAVLLARLLGAEGFGIYSFAYAVVSLLALPAQVGLPNLLVRETALGMTSAGPEHVKGMWVWAGRVVFILSTILALGAIAFLFLTGDGEMDTQTVTILWALGLVPLVALGNLRGAALRGLKKIVSGQFPEFILRPALLVVLVSVLAFVAAPVTAPQAMASHVGAAAIAFGVGGWLLWRHTPPTVRQASPRMMSKAWISSLIPLALISGIATVERQTDILMLGWLESASQVGIYRVAVQSAALVSFGLQAIKLVLAPRFVDLYSAGDVPALQRLMTRSTRVVLAFSAAVAVLFWIFGRFLLGAIFGTDFEAAYPALAIVVGGQVVNSMVGSVGQLLIMSGHERDTAWASAFGVLFNVLLNVALIPRLGISGAAIATAVAMIARNIWLWWAAKKRVGINSLALRLPKD